jgi:uncharacterized membrane protein YeaQ/YmgE (transglycosylase-associated protein family)
MKSNKKQKLTCSDFLYSLSGGVFGAIVLGGIIEKIGIKNNLYFITFCIGALICLYILMRISIDKK